MDTPISCFPRRQIKASLCLGTACRSQAVQSDHSHCPQNQYATPTPPPSPVYYLRTAACKLFLYVLMERTLVWINKSNNQWAQGSRQNRVSGRNNPSGPKDQVLWLERPQDGRPLETTRSLLVCVCWKIISQSYPITEIHNN